MTALTHAASPVALDAPPVTDVAWSIVATSLSKRFGSKVAVDDLSFRVRPGQVTGFLGPNGAGKSTALRLMLGLDQGGGRTTFDGKRSATTSHR